MAAKTWLAGVVVMASLVAGATPADDAAASRKPAPGFEAGLDWLNVDKPLKLADLRGKIVLIDFWTYCCINCMHVIPDLKRLEAKYPNELVVVGVHSAKFLTEKGTDNVREAVLRYEVAHPVVNDKDFAVWNAYGATSWPTFMLIDHEGRIVKKKRGEGVYEALEPLIADLVKAADAENKLDRRPLKVSPERDKAPRSLLRFPGKLAVDAAGERLAVSDSNHNRIVLLSLKDGAVLEAIGGEAAGFKDGTFAEARFDKPQGVTFDGGARVVVADTGNHAIRSIDLKARTVETIAGTGEQARKYNVGGVGREVALNSPWDVAVSGDRLFVAMAGPHQIWTVDLATREAKPYAGSTRETLRDGLLLEAALAQPSGLAIDGRKLYFADSEVSAIRAADLNPNGEVSTLIGKGLFDFGDADGKFDGALLQHPLGVAWHDGALYVADTYNNKVKRIDLAAGTITTVVGTGRAGLKDGPAAESLFNEPNGLAAAGGKVYIADTNNHAIRIYDPKAGRVETLRIREMGKLIPPHDPAAFRGRVVRAEGKRRVGVGAGTIDVAVTLPKGCKINADAPTYVAASAEDAKVVEVNPHPATTPPPVKLPVTFVAPGRTVVRTDLVIYYCADGSEGVCLVDQVRVETVVDVVAGETSRAVAVEALVR
jgi:sugar lactone lactonase YvrE/thiol-disulfide isomerase/thioredoxin